MKLTTRAWQSDDVKDRCTKPAECLRRPRRATLADHLLSGPRWPDDLVEQINDRARDLGRDRE